MPKDLTLFWHHQMLPSTRCPKRPCLKSQRMPAKLLLFSSSTSYQVNRTYSLKCLFSYFYWLNSLIFLQSISAVLGSVVTGSVATAAALWMATGSHSNVTWTVRWPLVILSSWLVISWQPMESFILLKMYSNSLIISILTNWIIFNFFSFLGDATQSKRRITLPIGQSTSWSPRNGTNF